MKKGLIVIFILLGVAFLGITLVKNIPEDPQQDSEMTKVEDSKRSMVINFWDRYHEATDLRTSGKHRQASDQYKKALELNPEHQNALYYYGNMNLVLGNYREAEKAWKKLTTLNAASSRGHSQLGILYSCPDTKNDSYDLDTATAQFRRALELNREETGPLLQLAKINLIKKNTKQAEEQLNDVVASNFRSAEAIFLQGYLSWKAGENHKAATALNESRSILMGTSEKKNVGEGDTRKDESSKIVHSTRCDIYDGTYPAHLLEADETSVNADQIYQRLDKALLSLTKK